MTICSCILVSSVCSLRVLDDYTFEVEALVAGSKDDEKKLIGPRLFRGLLRQRTWHTQMLCKLVLGLIQTGVLITCSSRAASLMTRSVTFTVPCTIPRRLDQEQLSILERFGKLYSGSTTNPGTWIDTVTPERLRAGIHDL